MLSPVQRSPDMRAQTSAVTRDEAMSAAPKSRQLTLMNKYLHGRGRRRAQNREYNDAEEVGHVAARQKRRAAARRKWQRQSAFYSSMFHVTLR